MYTENIKTLLEKKKDTEINTIFMNWKTKHKMSILPELIRFNAITFKIPAKIFVAIDKIILFLNVYLF